jgi:hypothetical protein
MQKYIPEIITKIKAKMCIHALWVDFIKTYIPLPA